jgi:hypothetical protein
MEQWAHPHRSQMLLVTDAGQHQQLGSLNGAGTQHHLCGGGSDDFATRWNVKQANADSLLNK